jgi:hypothetical protein
MRDDVSGIVHPRYHHKAVKGGFNRRVTESAEKTFNYS